MARSPYPGACVEEYMSWFRSVSHPDVIHAEDNERPLLVPSDARGHGAHLEESHPEHPGMLVTLLTYLFVLFL